MVAPVRVNLPMGKLVPTENCCEALSHQKLLSPEIADAPVKNETCPEAGVPLVVTVPEEAHELPEVQM